jgi:hypothetical protein
MASTHAGELVRNFSAYYHSTRSEGQGIYQSYIISHKNNREKLKALCNLLDLNAIRYFSSVGQQNITGYDYTTGKSKSITVQSGDLIISAVQPRSTLVQVLFDPEPFLVDSLTYDITSWSLPHVFGVEALASSSVIVTQNPYVIPKRQVELIESPFAFFIPWQNTASAHLLAQLLKNDVRVRISGETIINYGQTHLPGTLIITKTDNKDREDLVSLVSGLAEKSDHSIYATPTGLSSSGPDLGSNKITLIRSPKILLLGDEGVRSNDFGQTWYYFEKCLQYPVTICRLDEFRTINLDKYNTLVLPHGTYPQLNESLVKKIGEWVANGGKLICTGNALQKFKNQTGFSLTDYTTEENKKKADEEKKEDEKNKILKIYGDRLRMSISDDVPGAIVKTKLDTSHPLAYGFADYYFSLKTGSDIFQLQKNAWNVSSVENDPLVLGFAGNNVRKKLEGSVSFAVEDKGKGTIIYMVDDPLFRGFWENGKFLFSNALFMVGN